jgi:hypothetical protein
MDVVRLPDLVREVEQRAASSPLDRVEAALGVSEELASGADELIGHFVTEARQAGCSWTQIGARIGVSKQAARQRFTLQPAPVASTGPARQRRRRGKRAAQQCSFCGKEPASGVRLVAGPGVWICAECVTLATEIIAEAERGGSHAR